MDIVTISTIISGTNLTAIATNRILFDIGLLEINTGRGGLWKVTKSGLRYGINQPLSKNCSYTEPRWYPGIELLEKVFDYLYP